MKKKVRGLVLQGGGEFGAYECGVIKALYLCYPDFRLDVVSGVSIGAINAAVLVGAKNDPVNTLEKTWLERFAVMDWPSPFGEVQYLFPPILGTPGMSQIRFDSFLAPFRATSIYDTSPLLRTLQEIIDLNRLNTSPTHLVTTAVDIETGELTYFENKNQRSPFSLEMVLASGSLAPNFPMTRARDQRSGKESWYWDGGFSSNLPLTRVINLLEQCDNGNEEVEREVFIIELFPMRAHLPTNMLEVHNRIIQLLFSSKMKLDQKLFNQFDSYIDLMHLIDGKIPDEVMDEIRQNDKAFNAYQSLIGHRKIKYIVITSTRSESLSGAGDFSKATIKDRIEAGYQDTFNKLDELDLIPV